MFISIILLIATVKKINVDEKNFFKNRLCHPTVDMTLNTYEYGCTIKFEQPTK